MLGILKRILMSLFSINIILILFYLIFDNLYSKISNGYYFNVTNITILNIDQIKTIKFPNRVPKLIHYIIGDETKIPIQYKSLIQSCIEVNPDIKFVLWTDKSILSLIKIHYPQKESLYSSYLTGEPEKLKKSDIARPFIIYKYGGIYMDLDTKCQKPLRNVMISYKHSCIFSSQIEVQLMILYGRRSLSMNSFIACIPQHNFFRYLLVYLKVDNKVDAIMFTTGPFYIQEMLDRYNKEFEMNLTSIYSHVGIGDWRLFSPYLVYYLKSICETIRNKTSLQILGCQQYDYYENSQSIDMNAATVVHMFMNLGYSRNSHFVKNTFSIKLFEKSIIVVEKRTIIMTKKISSAEKATSK